MDIPQTGRQPIALSDKDKRALLRKRRVKDKSDPFATDPNRKISELGRLALRREDVNDIFALGDMCATHALTDKSRLLIFYVGKTLIAYRRALSESQNAIDRKRAIRAIEDFTDWVLDVARKFPTRRNISVALWTLADNDEQQNPKYERTHHRAVLRLLDGYQKHSQREQNKQRQSDKTSPKMSTQQDGDFTAIDPDISIGGQ